MGMEKHAAPTHKPVHSHTYPYQNNFCINEFLAETIRVIVIDIIHYRTRELSFLQHEARMPRSLIRTLFAAMMLCHS